MSVAALPAQQCGKKKKSTEKPDEDSSKWAFTLKANRGEVNIC